MNQKSLTVSNVINEIEKLTTYYDEIIATKQQKIDQHYKTIKDLHDNIDQLKKENDKFVSKRKINVNNTNDTLLFEYASSNEYESLEAFVSAHPTPENVFTLLRYILYAINEKNVSVMNSILFQLVNQIGLQHVNNSDLDNFINSELFTDTIEEVFELFFLNKEYFYDDSYDRSIILLLNLMMDLDCTSSTGMVKEFINKYFDEFLENILDTNYPKIITPFLRVCYFHSCHIHLRKALKHILKIDWDFLHKDLDDEDLSVIFWYSYLLDIDRLFFDTIAIEDAKKLENNEAYKLYYYVKDCEEKTVIFNKVKYNCN